MTPQIIGVIGLFGLIVLTLGRVPLGAAMGIVGFLLFVFLLLLIVY